VGIRRWYTVLFIETRYRSGSKIVSVARQGQGAAKDGLGVGEAKAGLPMEMVRLV
jgi:hypothetical protein